MEFATVDFAQKNNLRIIDVREEEEYNKGHVEGAENIPMGKLLRQYASDQIDLDNIFLYCGSGFRCKLTANGLETLKEKKQKKLGTVFVLDGAPQ